MKTFKIFVYLCFLSVLMLTISSSMAKAGTLFPGEKTPAGVFDKNNDKIFEHLFERMEDASIVDLLSVIVVLKEMPNYQTKNNLNSILGNYKPRHEYKHLPFMAMDLTIKEILNLATSDMIKHIEFDKIFNFTIQDANYWFGVENAWDDFGLDGTGIVVAVLDSGIDVSHVDLDEGKVIGWKDIVNDLAEPYDDLGHGTAVAGIIAGDGDGNTNYKGVASGAKLIGVKVGRYYIEESDIIEGIDWCIDNKDDLGIDIINMSLGDDKPSDGTDAVSMAVNDAVDHGMVVVIAAGNTGPLKGSVGSPGTAGKVLSVGAMADVAEDGFNLAVFSSRGPTADDRIKPDIVAPGVNIICPTSGSTNGYSNHSGTSMAAPFVSGVAALMLEADPTLTHAEIKSILETTAQDWGDPGKDNEYGHGKLDAYEAIKEAGRYTGDNISLPDHLTASGGFTNGKQSTDIWEFQVNDTAYPIAITLVEDQASCFLNASAIFAWYPMNIELALLDSDDNILTENLSKGRHGEIFFQPQETGIYRLKAFFFPLYQSNAPGDYRFDISAGLNEAAGLILIQDE